MAKVTLTIAILLVAVTTASTATSHANPPIYNVDVNGVSLSTACLPSDSPCRTKPDDW